ncbi:2-succinyl-6-hydroxy-2,4-cyclohexadiene-1-carboxylate synthase [Crinalium epipsammum PCC 9333]|uniref:Putative 2-succinyl-6-hydroxy-2,4-cyclohexadiene-1-carboxylate synthase n=1 Tax=Crinalium epipsammum PCC 9333 TaxID=1173022 RepID=K9W4K7_9CYAN|nr:2-succinyl-6-hydroxy-2,4-cyclohexadiene-1-carboxylate synthase [Crinalium epipsammum]AFZ14677.1 2-succinyl-6-hydroxy-2,4-cyclohexadiene-1-carboxylate synthase [Crinalium epipsammum PCC 9333]
MPIQQVANYQFNYSLTGGEEKPLLLLLHGFMGSSNDFQDVITLLSEKFCCLAVDLPGHGKTKIWGSQECYSMENIAQALINLLESLKINQCFLFGYSMGGRLAFYLALKFPQYFAKVILESASPGLKTAPARLDRIKHDAELATEIESNDFGEFLNKWYQQPIFSSIKIDPKFNTLLERRLQNNPLEVAKSLRYMSIGCQPCLWQHLVSNQLPLLLLVGEFDQKFIEINQEIANCCPIAHLEIIKNSSHNVHFEQPHLWLNNVENFLLSNVI